MITATNAHTIAWLVGLLVPLVVGYISKPSWPSNVKAFLNLALSSLAAVLTQVTIGDAGVHWTVYVGGILSTWVVSITAHYGLHRPTGLTTAVANHGVTDDPEPDPEPDLLEPAPAEPAKKTAAKRTTRKTATKKT